MFTVLTLLIKGVRRSRRVQEDIPKNNTTSVFNMIETNQLVSSEISLPGDNNNNNQDVVRWFGS